MMYLVMLNDFNSSTKFQEIKKAPDRRPKAFLFLFITGCLLSQLFITHRHTNLIQIIDTDLMSPLLDNRLSEFHQPRFVGCG